MSDTAAPTVDDTDYRRRMASADLGLTPLSFPSACTLPTAEQPLRVAEFDAVFASAVLGVDRMASNRVRFRLSPVAGVAERVANLIVRETECCSFFTFTMTAAHGALDLEVDVAAAYVDLLEALAARVAHENELQFEVTVSTEG